jgi:hypothetical protein
VLCPCFLAYHPSPGCPVLAICETVSMCHDVNILVMALAPGQVVRPI